MMPVQIVDGLIPAIQAGLVDEGYYFVRQFEGAVLLDLARTLGPVTVDPRHPIPIRFITPQELSQANPNTLSSRYGLGPFPFHTDVAHWSTPAEIVLLYCVSTGSGERPTLLTDSREWQVSDSFWRLMCDAIWRTGFVRPFLCTVASKREQNRRVRYDPGCMIPRSRTAVEAARLTEEHLSKVTPVRVDWCNQDLLVLDNTRVLHARGPASRPDCDRVIARMLIGGSYEDVGFKAAMAEGQSACRPSQ